MNSSIAKLLLEKTEGEAALILGQFKKNWRIIFRDGKQSPNLTPERDDRRYGLVITNGKVSKVIFG